MSEPLRVLGWASLFDDEEPCAVSLFEADLRHSRGETIVPLVDGNAAEADRAKLLALLEEARALMNEAPQPGVAEAGRVYIQQWHERRRAFIAKLEGTKPKEEEASDGK